jgi:hypothetical protein
MDCPRCRRREQARLRRRDRDTGDLMKALVRQIRAAGPRVAEADLEDLAVLLELRGLLDGAIATGIAGIKRSGATWAEIGALTGTTRQSAQERWGRRLEHQEEDVS